MLNTKFLHAAFCIVRIIYGLAQISLSLIVQASYIMSLTKEHITPSLTIWVFCSVSLFVFSLLTVFSTSKRESPVSERIRARSSNLNVQVGHSLIR